MYEKILVPLDGSELAEVALPYAEELAGRLGSTITLLYVSESAEFEDEYRRMHKFYVQEMAENTRQEIEKKWGKHLVNEIKVNSEILFGRPAEEIIDYANQEKMGLIVMSTHGRTGLGRWAIGSVAYKVVKAASQPIAIIRAKGGHSAMREKDKLNRILVPLDGSQQSEAVIPYVEELATRLKAELTLVQALTPDYGITSERQLQQLESIRESAKNYIESMATRFKQKGIAARAILKEAVLDPTGVAREIMLVADEIKADMVAMSTRGRSAFEPRPGEYAENLGSIAEKLVQSGSSPLLLVKPLTTKNEDKENCDVKSGQTRDY